MASENDVFIDDTIVKTATEQSVLEEIEDELSWDDIQRLGAAFVICILGTAAHKGSIFWTLMFFMSILICGIWWASDKTDEIVQRMMKPKDPKQKYQFHDEF